MALLLGLLDNETQAKRVVKLGLEIDLKLGARLAGEVNFKFQKQTVGLVLGLDVPKRFKVELLGLTKSNQVVNELLKALKDSDGVVRRNAVEALGKIGTETAIAGLLKALEESNKDVRWKAAFALGDIKGLPKNKLFMLKNNNHSRSVGGRGRWLPPPSNFVVELILYIINQVFLCKCIWN